MRESRVPMLHVRMMPVTSAPASASGAASLLSGPGTLSSSGPSWSIWVAEPAHSQFSACSADAVRCS